MTEQEWLTCNKPLPMIDFLLSQTHSDRKWRLFACTWYRDNKRYNRFAGIVAVGERMADGLALPHEIDHVRNQARYTGALQTVMMTVNSEVAHSISPVFLHEFASLLKNLSVYVHTIHDIFGNPFRPVSFDSNWRTQKVLALANMIYDQRAYELMPILADELEEAGCDIVDLLSHCRGVGPHVRGCWAVDQALGKN